MNKPSSQLQTNAQLIFEKIPKSKWHYFHKKTVDNFIYHLPNLGDINYVEQVLNNYLIEVDQQYILEEINMDMSEHLWNQYLAKIAKRYSNTLDFFPLFGKYAYILLGPLMIFTLYILRKNFIIFLILLFLLCFYYGIIIYKGKKRKLYGFGY